MRMLPFRPFIHLPLAQELDRISALQCCRELQDIILRPSPDSLPVKNSSGGDTIVVGAQLGDDEVGKQQEHEGLRDDRPKGGAEGTVEETRNELMRDEDEKKVKC